MQPLRKDKPLGMWLKENITGDLEDRRAPWRDKVEHYEKMRMSQHRKNELYDGAPNTVEPIIDDNVRYVTSSENQIIWSSRQLANFVPMTPESGLLKRDAEIGFNGLLEYILKPRAKINAVLDQKNSAGMGILKLVTNDESYKVIFGEDRTIPDFEFVEAFDVIVPMATKKMSDAERICHRITYTPRELLAEGRKRGWDERKLREIIDSCQEERSAEENGNKIVEREVQSAETSILIWECYYHTDDNNKRVCWFCPDRPEKILKDIPWTWYAVEPGTVEAVEVPITDPMTGSIIGYNTEYVEVPAEERRWPFYQARYEDRNLRYHDTRGIGELLNGHQNTATQFSRVRGMHFDFNGRPLYRGPRGSLDTFSFAPGSLLPPGVEPVPPTPVDPQLSYSTDIEKASAARRVGSQVGSLSSVDAHRDRKTAAEVKQESFTSQSLGRDSIMRFSEPFGELFQDMWNWLVKNPVPLPKLTRRNQEFVSQGMTDDAIYRGVFCVQPAANSRALNPDMILQQLSQVVPFFQWGDQRGIVYLDQLLKLVVDQINPQVTDQVIVNANNGAPIEQTVQQLVAQVQKNSQYIAAAAQEDMHEEQIANIRKAIDEELKRRQI